MAKQPDLHILLGAVGCWGLLNQLLPETYPDAAKWTDIFSDSRLYQTAAVEVRETTLTPADAEARLREVEGAVGIDPGG